MLDFTVSTMISDQEADRLIAARRKREKHPIDKYVVEEERRLDYRFMNKSAFSRSKSKQN